MVFLSTIDSNQEAPWMIEQNCGVSLSTLFPSSVTNRNTEVSIVSLQESDSVIIAELKIQQGLDLLAATSFL